MKFTRVKTLLSIKSIYTSLSIFLMQSGCSSGGYLHKMNENSARSSSARHKREDSSESSSSSSESLSDESLEDISRMFGVVNNFLGKGKGQIHTGDPISRDIIIYAIKGLSKHINSVTINLLPYSYKEFLKEYGSMYGDAFDIYGPIGDITNLAKGEYIASQQSGFKNFCRTCTSNMKEEEIKSLWLIGEIGEENQYYINTSKGGKIYSINRNGEVSFFANGFLDFLKKILDIYKK